ncbi:MAG: PSD1 and planctomycete cytochrome C domain-containing protein [Gemmataceae bacterium]
MMLSSGLISGLLFGVPLWLPFAEPKSGAMEGHFALKVLPVFQNRCFPCHGDDAGKLRGGLDIRSPDGLRKGGDSGKPAVIHGKPDDSLLYQSVTRKHTDVAAMPPKESDRLSNDEVASIRLWIEKGAIWPDDKTIAQIKSSQVASSRTVKTSGGQNPEWSNRSYNPEDLWAYQPLKKMGIPKVVAKGNPVDSFLEAKLKQAGLLPSRLADRRTLARRAHLDLTGLPPTEAQINTFVEDRADDDQAWEKLVDGLLGSQHHAEQMARHWLDVTRYADSSGYANDYDRGNAWRYRDYVVRSFHSNKPFNQFVMEQVAGDEMDPQNPEMLVATGFLRMGAWELTGMEVPRVARQRFLDDVTDTVGQAFLGHMLQCARCHDHKFDPVPTRDYYSMQAIFATTQLVERAAPFLPIENTAGFSEKNYLDARKQWLEGELERIKNAEGAAKKKWLADHPEKAGQKPPRHEFLPPADLGMERIARKGLERLKWEYDRYEPFALAVYTGKTPTLKAVYAPLRMPGKTEVGEFETTSILAGGDPFSPGMAVAPGVLSVLGEYKVTGEPIGRRLALARWLAGNNNPLTLRVMANRIWQWTMGSPLAGNPNNFGATGKKPTHPELLEWLASSLAVNSNIRELQKTILMSHAYRRSGEYKYPVDLDRKDPNRQLYAVHRSRRLAAEEIRDAMLHASGELNPAMGGIPVRPQLHQEVAFQPRQVMGTFAPAWQPSPRAADRNRRTIYTLKLRGMRDPFLEVFDVPVPDSCSENRESSTITPQVFALFNSSYTRNRAMMFARRLLRETTSPEQAIARAFQIAFGRQPQPGEMGECLKHWDSMTVRHQGHQWPSQKMPSQIQREAVEENTGERFSFQEPLFASRDFEPDFPPEQVTARLWGLMEVCLVLFNSNEFLHVQ